MGKTISKRKEWKHESCFRCNKSAKEEYQLDSHLSKNN